MTMICEREQEVKATGDELVAFAEGIRRRLRRKGAPGQRPAGDWEDVLQNAALSAIETEARYGIALRSNAAYHRSAARKTAGLQISRALSRVSFGEKKARRAREWQDGVPIAGCGYAEEDSVDVIDTRRPDARLAADERRSAAGALLRIVAHHLRRRAGTRWRALELLLGIGGEQAEDLAEAAWRTGVSTQAIVSAIDELGEAVRADRAARKLRRVMAANMEEQTR